MDAIIKAAWVDDLRSGPPQSKHFLQTEVGFCCLGRLVVVMQQLGYDSAKEYKRIIPKNPLRGILAVPYYRGYSEAIDSVLTGAVMKDADLDPSDSSRLIRMNDDGKTFSEIADYIEGNL